MPAAKAIPRSGRHSRSPYHAYKLIGALAVIAVIFTASVAMLFVRGASFGMPAQAGGAGTQEGAGAEHKSGHAPGLGRFPLDLINENAFVVCIDPGHGYDDPGAICEETMGSITEKDVDLAVSLLLRDRLEEAGIKIIMTRLDDAVPADYSGSRHYTFDPFERVDFVNAHPEIDLFISIHCNTYISDPSVGGTRIYTYTGGAEGTAQFAAELSDSISAAFSDSVPIIAKNKAEAYYVTKMLSMPSVLIELGFITNAEDAKNLLSDEWRGLFADSIAAGVVSFLNSLA